MMAWGIWIDVSKSGWVGPGATMGVKKVQELMEGEGHGSGGWAGGETVKHDGLGDLD